VTVVSEPIRPGTEEARAPVGYIVCAFAVAIALSVLAWRVARPPDLLPLGLLCAMGVLSWNLREPDVGSRISFSFLSIILLASSVIVGPFGAAVVGFVSVAVDFRSQPWYLRLFNVSMSAIIGVAGALAYMAVGGASALGDVLGVEGLTFEVGLPLAVADVVECVTNSVLLAGVVRLHRGVPFFVVLRGVIAGSGFAYLGYGIIGFLFVILWFPADLGAFSAVLILAPLLAARWAFIQYGDELRAHERTVDTLVTALGTKVPFAVSRSRRCARLAAWIAEEMGLSPHQIDTARYAATLYEIGELGMPTQLLRRDPATLTPGEQRVLAGHPEMGARMIEGIDFLEDARTALRHQHDRFDGHRDNELPIASRIVAVAARFEELTTAVGEEIEVGESLAVIESESGGRFDPAVVAALREALDKQSRPPQVVGAEAAR
jgi:HD-GYP domain-containing protein (c-di-GMP phosphodiesterase class II)